MMELNCVILHQPPKDPVICADGHLYERWAIQDHFEREGAMSPLTKRPVSTKLLPVKVSLSAPEQGENLSPPTPNGGDVLSAMDQGRSVSVPLLWAVKGGHVDLIEAFLSVPGIDPNVPSRSTGETITDVVLGNGRSDILLLLLQHPAVHPPSLEAVVATRSADLLQAYLVHPRCDRKEVAAMLLR